MKPKMVYLIIPLIIVAVLLLTGSLVAAHGPNLLVQSTKQIHPNADTTLDVCMLQEPTTLYYYTDQRSNNQNAILAAVFDGPIDNRSYSYHPVIFESVPTLENGQAITATMTVTSGDMILDSSGQVVPLAIGISYLPSGCYGGNCAVTYTGGPAIMEQLVVTDTLLSDITWSDGHPLTSEDMLYSFNLNKNPDTPASKYEVDRTSAFVAASLTQTVWTGLPGYFPYYFPAEYWMPLPEHVWGAYTPTELISANISSRTPLGWGAYVIDEWVPGDHISMHKNPLYFRAVEGLPHFDSLTVHFGTELVGILNGACDVVVRSSDDFRSLMNYENAGTLQVQTALGLPNYEYLRATELAWEHLDFGIQSSDVYTGFAAISGAFQDVQVRQAFAYCIDRKAIADTVFFGRSQVANAFIPDDHPYFPANATIYPYDLAKGKALLETAGWIDNDGDGIREKGGLEFSITLKTTTANYRTISAPMVVSQLAACGIQVDLIYIPQGEYFTPWPDGPVY
jgi:peptide/nickel transport system substrate-binding protein